MSFSQFSTLENALKTLQITGSEEAFVVPAAVEVSAHLRYEIDFTQKFVGLPRSEQARRENLIYPILRETWKHFPQLQIWSNEPIEYDANLTGTPDYIVASRSPLGVMVMSHPYLLVMEAKKDDFDWGWGQCMAGMVAAREVQQLAGTGRIRHRHQRPKLAIRQAPGRPIHSRPALLRLVALGAGLWCYPLHVRAMPAATGRLCRGRVIKSGEAFVGFGRKA